MNTNEFDYNLPDELIAQLPTDKRDLSRMMTININTRRIEHKKFFDIVDMLDENDVLVMNNTRVIPARLFGKKQTGANIEVFLLTKLQEINQWEVLIKPSKRVKDGTIIEFSEELSAKVLSRLENDKWAVELIFDGNFDEILKRTGNIPLPPYIERKMSDEQIENLDYERYQTVYAEVPGSVAAPTAGLHFTDELLQKIKNKGIQVCNVTLNVGLGTFKPVKADNILDHIMDKEYYEISEETANIINTAKKNNKKVVAVGTTTVRTLESAFIHNGKVCACSGWSQLFIYPGYNFNVIDKLITNFHLPKSTLLMLVSALAGKDFIFEAYNQAIKEKYRFYSYGDCMFIHS